MEYVSVVVRTKGAVRAMLMTESSHMIVVGYSMLYKSAVAFCSGAIPRMLCEHAFTTRVGKGPAHGCILGSFVIGDVLSLFTNCTEIVPFWQIASFFHQFLIILHWNVKLWKELPPFLRLSSFISPSFGANRPLHQAPSCPEPPKPTARRRAQERKARCFAL